jgi:outer membrane protein OmpA-like peptidoglycan-associated protein
VRLASNQGVSDAELGFKPSSAPPLNPSINQWVAAPIVDRYRQTASNAGITTPTVQAAVPAVGAPAMNRSVTASATGAAPTAVVYFPEDGIKLSAAARKEIRTAAQLFKATGGSATVRVIGHSSSRTANMSVEKHLETIFDKSQKRANAVAQELIHDGVPATRVLVEAVGDSQPVYYESMPQGEAGNRRAEIFVQT